MLRTLGEGRIAGGVSMNTQAPEKGWLHLSLGKAWGNVLLSALVVPIGVVSAWFLQAPSAASLAEEAARGADTAALLELVHRASYQKEASERLRTLISHDPEALNALASLAMGHEAALSYFILVARTQPEVLVSLERLEMSYAFALGILRHMNPAGISTVEKYAATCANASFMLGVAYENGCHVSRDWGKAATWYGKAVESHYAMAEFYYKAAAYQAGLESAAPEVAVKWYRVAAERGHAAAQCALGVCCASGHGVAADLQEAVRWYRLAAEQERSDAQYNLGWCYLHGEGVEVNAAEAVRWFIKAAEQGDDLAQYYVGRAYELGEGLEQDFAAAVQWYSWSVEHGNPSAQCALGHCYAQGRGVPQDWHKAVYWYKLSAGQGRSEAQLALAHCYESGLGVPCDVSAADHWRRIAAESEFLSKPN